MKIVIEWKSNGKIMNAIMNSVQLGSDLSSKGKKNHNFEHWSLFKKINLFNREKCGAYVLQCITESDIGVIDKWYYAFFMGLPRIKF